MGNIIFLLIAAGLLVGLIRLIFVPIKLVWKLAINGLCGLVCLWLVNLASGITGLVIPINAVTAIVTGTLGLPGLIILAVVQLFL